MRVSTARSVELIAQAKAQGLPITASTTWMHLLLDTTAIKKLSHILAFRSAFGKSSGYAMLAGSSANRGNRCDRY